MYLDSAEILEVNPDIAKRVLSLTPKEQEDYRVSAGWHRGKVLSNHILRICPNDKIRPGYLQCALGHPQLGRPQLVRFAFGSSVPEIAPEDVSTAIVPRLPDRLETEIAELVEQAATARDEADRIEQSLAFDAEQIIDSFLAGDREQFLSAL